MDDSSLVITNGKNLSMKKGPVRVLGIDLGTTNSTIAETIYNPALKPPMSARCLEVKQDTSEGTYTHVLVPSVVALHSGREVVGEGAKQLLRRAASAGLEQNKNIFYECKNDIGVLRTYHKAPEGFRSASEIGGKVLSFLRQAAESNGHDPASRIVVTVPASFQAGQRADTLRAAELAGIKITANDLLDEPVAAFIDYLVTKGGAFKPEPGRSSNLVVFDFGGGTCDVAVFTLTPAMDTGRPGISPKAVSRYHRLGGGDIDAAILYEVLLPQILSQNGLDEFNLGYAEKKLSIEPAFIGLAEALKTGLCNTVTRLKKFGTLEKMPKKDVFKRQPGTHACTLTDGRTLKLIDPSLSLEQFETLLIPFLEKDLLYARETEYRLTCTVFAPLQDALERSRLERTEIDYCLLTGGSCLIPQVTDAVREFFPNAEMLTYDDAEALQTSVARGAAYHALSLALTGEPMVRPVCHDTISINTQSGPVDLIPQGAELPYPADGSFAKAQGLSVPDSSLIKPVDLRVEITAKQDGRTLLKSIWQVPAPVNRGDKVCLEYRLDENQVLDMRMRLSEVPEAKVFTATLQNPLTNVVNPQAARIRIDETEENLRTGRVPKEKQAETIVKLADEYSQLSQNEKALEYLGRVLRSKNSPDAIILNKMAMICGTMGDASREEKLYLEAARNTAWGGPWFNLALAQRRRKKYTEARESIEKAIAADDDGSSYTLKAMIEESPGNAKAKSDALDQAMTKFKPVASMIDWELGWYLTAARMAGKGPKEEEALAEQRRRRVAGNAAELGGILPILDPTPARR